jgi:FAIM1 (Fas apoptotic inhibitory molecule) protein/uncharacterized protein DUF3592
MARRHWEFDLEDGHHQVDFVHGYFFGKRTITIDGTTTSQQGWPLTNHAGEYRFPFGSHDARVRITTNGLKYFYDLVVDGREIRTGEGAGTVARPRIGGPGQQRIFGAVIVLIAIPTLAFFGKSGYDEYRYHTASATAVGTVLDKRVVTGRYGDSYRLTYQFVDSRAATHRGSDDVSRTTYNQARPGSTYSVQYLQGDPGINRFTGKDETLLIAGLLSLDGVAVAFGAWMFLTGNKRLGTVKRISTGGQPVTATVTKLKKAQLQYVGKTVTIEYEYDDSFGRRRRGRGPLMYPTEAARYAVGGSVRVLIDPDRPGESVLP